MEDQTGEVSGSVSAGEEGSVKDEGEEPVTSGLSPLSDESKSQKSPLSDIPSPTDSPSQSELVQTLNQKPLPNGDLSGSEEPVDSSNHVSVGPVSPNKMTDDSADVSPAAKAANGVSLPLVPVVLVEKCNSRTISSTSPPPSPRATRSLKRKREEMSSGNSEKKLQGLMK